MTDNHLIDCSLTLSVRLVFWHYSMCPNYTAVIAVNDDDDDYYIIFSTFLLYGLVHFLLFFYKLFFSVFFVSTIESSVDEIALLSLELKLTLTLEQSAKLFEELFFFSLIFVHVPINSLIQTPLYFAMVLREVSIIVTI